MKVKSVQRVCCGYVSSNACRNPLVVTKKDVVGTAAANDSFPRWSQP